MTMHEKIAVTENIHDPPTWHGVISPMITPLKSPDSLDVEGLERLILHIVTAGVNAIFILGTTGEGPCLSRQLRREMVGRTCRIVRSRVPVLVGVTDCSLTEAVASMREAAHAGADAVVAAPPFYLPLDQLEVVRYYRQLAEQAPLPLFVYNMPALTKITIQPQSVAQLLDIERIVGLKDSSGEKEHYLAMIDVARQRPGWPVFTGREHLLVDAFRAGGAGGVCAGSNVFPEHFVGLYAAICAGDDAAVENFQKATALRQKIYGLLDHGTAGTIQTLKACLALLEICEDCMSDPFDRLSAVQFSRLAAIMTQLGASIVRQDFKQ